MASQFKPPVPDWHMAVRLWRPKAGSGIAEALSTTA